MAYIKANNKSFTRKKRDLEHDELEVNILCARILSRFLQEWDTTAGPVPFSKHQYIDAQYYESIKATCGIDGFMDKFENLLCAVLDTVQVYEGKLIPEDSMFSVTTIGGIVVDSKELPFCISVELKLLSADENAALVASDAKDNDCDEPF